MTLREEVVRRVDALCASSTISSPLVHSAALSRLANRRILLKCEHCLPTGSFKYRGALAKVAALGSNAGSGVVTASTGNHGLAVAWIAAARDIPVHVFAPGDAAPDKLDAIRGLGAEPVLVNCDALGAEAAAREYAIATGLPYISPYNDLDVISGHAAIGLEIMRDAPGVEAIYAAVGGGGLIAGGGCAAKAVRSATQIIGCWPERAAGLHHRLIAGGETGAAREAPTLSDATMGGAEEGSVTIPLCAELIDDHVLVPEIDIARAMWLAARHEHWIIEGAAGVALAAALNATASYACVAVILCGRNVALPRFMQTIAQFEPL